MMVIRDLQITDVDEGLAAGTIAFGMGNPGGGPDHRRGPLIQAGTIYKRQGKTLDHTYLLHTHHWRAAASYVALTRQRERAQVFVATETARDACISEVPCDRPLRSAIRASRVKLTPYPEKFGRPHL
ncbi:MAG TPA: hypothetical protein VKI44_07595 [Acetobacteraceae bacterium]|nr:hypothetical protein [Acetobacteraceae bacterium]